MSTSREKMLQAQQAIKEQRWNDARAILKTVDHPMALDWLDKINEQDPPKAKRSPVLLGLLVLIVALVLLIGGVYITNINRVAADAVNQEQTKFAKDMACLRYCTTPVNRPYGGDVCRSSCSLVGTQQP